MNLLKCILTNNDCYKSNKKITPKGVMVHSTGVNNKTLKRYVQPSKNDENYNMIKERIGTNLYNNDWNRSGLDVCVHGFIGTLADGSIATIQTLPWNYRGWHCGDYANNTHISFEICEDGLNDKDYFEKTYKEAVELTAMLCKKYNLNPLKDGVVICHKEGYERGVASNHSDVVHWWSKFGVTMDNFRQDVKKEMEAEKVDNNIVSDWAKTAWEKAKSKGVLDGTNPKGTVTREMMAVILNALDLLD